MRFVGLAFEGGPAVWPRLTPDVGSCFVACEVTVIEPGNHRNHRVVGDGKRHDGRSGAVPVDSITLGNALVCSSYDRERVETGPSGNLGRLRSGDVLGREKSLVIRNLIEFVQRFHRAIDRANHLGKVREVVIGQLSVATVIEPPWEDLVGADLQFPGFAGYSVEVLLVI